MEKPRGGLLPQGQGTRGEAGEGQPAGVRGRAGIAVTSKSGLRLGGKTARGGVPTRFWAIPGAETPRSQFGCGNNLRSRGRPPAVGKLFRIGFCSFAHVRVHISLLEVRLNTDQASCFPDGAAVHVHAAGEQHLAGLHPDVRHRLGRAQQGETLWASQRVPE